MRRPQNSYLLDVTVLSDTPNHPQLEISNGKAIKNELEVLEVQLPERRKSRR